MEFGPILSAMRRNAGGAILVAAQMAITVCILCNAFFISQQRLAQTRRPSGTDEANIFVITNEWATTGSDLQARTQRDLIGLRSLSGVIDAYVTNSYPLTNNGTSEDLGLRPNQSSPTTSAALYYGDEHALQTLGANLIAGRNFNSDEIIERAGNEQPHPAGIIITQALADKLYPGSSALGQPVFLQTESTTTRIIGIVAKLQGPWVAGGGGLSNRYIDNSIVAPYRPLTQVSYYIVRTKPGAQASVMQAAQGTLAGLSRNRVIEKVLPLKQARVEAYQNTRGLAIVLNVICIVLLAVTGLGIVGLASYWVTLRKHQIGIRRALGATQLAIMRYFQTENLLIAAAATSTGSALGVALNLWMVSSFEMQRLTNAYILSSVVLVLLLGQIATLWPAMRAASLPPAIAFRSL